MHGHRSAGRPFRTSTPKRHRRAVRRPRLRRPGLLRQRGDRHAAPGRAGRERAALHRLLRFGGVVHAEPQGADDRRAPVPRRDEQPRSAAFAHDAPGDARPARLRLGAHRKMAPRHGDGAASARPGLRLLLRHAGQQRSDHRARSASELRDVPHRARGERLAGGAAAQPRRDRAPGPAVAVHAPLHRGGGALHHREPQRRQAVLSLPGAQHAARAAVHGASVRRQEPGRAVRRRGGRAGLVDGGDRALPGGTGTARGHADPVHQRQRPVVHVQGVRRLGRGRYAARRAPAGKEGRACRRSSPGRDASSRG